MRPDKSDIYFARCKNDNYNKSEVIAFDVEHISVVSHIVYRVKVNSNVGKRMPFRLS